MRQEAAAVPDLMAKAHRVDHPDLFGEVLPRFDLGVDGIGDLLERRAAEEPEKPFLVFYDDDARTRSDWTRGEWTEEVIYPALSKFNASGFSKISSSDKSLFQP